MKERLYVDASAAVKRFRTEVDSDLALAEMDRAGLLVTSRLTYTEVGRAIDAIAYEDDDMLRRWEARWEQHQVIELDDEITRHALALALYHRLRSSDAIHLASALSLRMGPLRFATWDARLWDAARAVGLRVVPPTRPGGAVAA